MPKKSTKTAPTATGEQTATPVDNVSERELVALLMKPTPDAEPGAGSSATDASAQPSPEPAPAPEATHEPPPAEQPESQPPPSEPPPADAATQEGDNTEPNETESADAPGEDATPSAREFEYPKFQRRVDSLTAKLRSAEAEVERLRSEAQPKTEAAAAPQPPKPISIPTPELNELDERLSQTQQVIDWAEQYRDGADDVPVAEGKTVSLTADQVRHMKMRAMNDLARLHAERQVKAAEITRARMAKLNADMQAAAGAYPWLKDQSSPEFAQGRAMIEQNPSLINDPDVVWIVAGAVEARKAKRGSATATRAASQAPAKPTPVVTKPAGQAPARNGADGVRKQLVEAQKRAEESGSISDYQQVLVLQTRLKDAARH